MNKKSTHDDTADEHSDWGHKNKPEGFVAHVSFGIDKLGANAEIAVNAGKNAAKEGVHLMEKLTRTVATVVVVALIAILAMTLINSR